MIETAEKGIKTFDSILKLQKQVDLDLLTLGRRSVNAQKIMTYLYNKPLLNAEKVNEVAGISYPSAYKLIGDLEDKPPELMSGGWFHRVAA